MAEVAGGFTWVIFVAFGSLIVFNNDGWGRLFGTIFGVLFGTPCGLVALVALAHRWGQEPPMRARTWVLAGVPALAGIGGFLLLAIG